VRGLTKLAPGAGNVGLSDRPEPAAAAGHVVLDVVAAGICGTDIHIYDVDAAWLGARVVTETYFSTCGHCRHCLDGRINLCLERRSIGSFVDGGFAPRLHVPARNLHRIPDWLDGRIAAMTEPLACCCQSLLNPERVGAGDSVLVIGPGPIGLLAAQVARAVGGDVHVRGTPRDAQRLEIATGLGLTTSTTDDGPAGDFDVVVECSGHEAGMTFALESARRGGRYVQIGLAGKPVAIPFDLVCFGELTVTSGNASTPTSWDRALQLIEHRQVDLEPLFSDAVPLADWEQAFAATRSGAGIKYVLVP